MTENCDFLFDQSPHFNYGGSIKSSYRPIGAELERTVTIEGLLVEIISIVIQRPSNPLYPVVKDEFQFTLLNFTQKLLNTSEKILRPGELLFCQYRLHAPEKPEITRR
jgi:hypothetical protein